MRDHERSLGDWDEDPTNPRNWSRRRKWLTTIVACYFSSLISIAASAYSLGEDAMVHDLQTSRLLVVAGISTFTIAVAIFPLILTPLGESFGRRYVYLTSYVLFFTFILPVALAQNIQTVLIARFLCASAGSVGSTMVGGTLSDMWTREERSAPMAFFALSALLGTPLGPITFSWTGKIGGWRWIHWVMLISALPSMVIALIVFREETLPSVLLRRRGYSLPVPAKPFKDVLKLSAARPLVFLVTEPITTALCLWISFAWGTLYLLLQSVPLVFRQFGFSSEAGTGGLDFIGLAIGSILGFSVVLFFCWKNPVRADTRPELHLSLACVGGVLFAGAFYWYAWTSHPTVHWIVPQAATSLLGCGLFMFYHSVFSYLSECYGTYTASAISAQSFLRNLFATAFPLFAEQMFHALGYTKATVILGAVATAMATFPFLLIRYGPILRARSPFVTALAGTMEAT